MAQEKAEWIIQRCTQKWIGTDLVYVDFPTPEGVMTRTEMTKVLERVNRNWPDEFRGHRLFETELASYSNYGASEESNYGSATQQ